jgi:hypothetical protein
MSALPIPRSTNTQPPRAAVVGHSATFGRMFEAHFRWDTNAGDYRLRNAEMRSLLVSF